MHLPHCSRQCSVESTKQWILVINYEGDYIKTMEWVDSYVNFIDLKQTNALTSILLTVFDWIDKTMNESDEEWRWVHQNYGTIWIIHKLYLFETKKCTYLSVTVNVKLNRRKSEW